MATIISLGAQDNGSTSRATINTNFTNLNSDKAEGSTVTAHTSATTGAHGITGSFIGSTDTQTMTNKTLTAPVIAGAMISGTLSAVSGTYGITGANISGALNSLSVREVDFVLSDNTTADVSTTKHGFIPKLPNNTTTFFRADGTFTAPTSTTAYLTASDTLQESADTEQSTTSTTDVKKKEIQVNYGGSIRVKMTLRGGSAGDGVIGTVFVNGVAAASAHNSEVAGNTTFSDDITIYAGDLVQGYLRKQTSGTAYMSNFRIYADKTATNLGKTYLD